LFLDVLQLFPALHEPRIVGARCLVSVFDVSSRAAPIVPRRDPPTVGAYCGRSHSGLAMTLQMIVGGQYHWRHFPLALGQINT
jgi:hypothetical protein